MSFSQPDTVFPLPHFQSPRKGLPVTVSTFLTDWSKHWWQCRRLILTLNTAPVPVFHRDRRTCAPTQPASGWCRYLTQVLINCLQYTYNRKTRYPTCERDRPSGAVSWSGIVCYVKLTEFCLYSFAASWHRRAAQRKNRCVNAWMNGWTVRVSRLHANSGYVMPEII